VEEMIRASGLGSHRISGDAPVMFFPPAGVVMGVEFERLCPVDPWVAAWVATISVTGAVGVAAKDDGSKVPCCEFEAQAARMRLENRINTDNRFIGSYSSFCPKVLGKLLPWRRYYKPSSSRLLTVYRCLAEM
jgi:hypothetical protein